MIALQQLTDFPKSLKNLSPQQVRQVFENPSLIELEGRRKEPIFISFLLHGNETTSFFVLQKLQKYLQDHPLTRSLILFVGNVYATEQGLRFLPGQEDYNRIWDEGKSAEHEIARSVKNYVQQRSPLFASIDIHNNSGINPFYACVSSLTNSHIHLASLFSRTLVYFKSPKSAQSVNFSELCPSVTLECGRSGQVAGVEKAFHYILDIIHSESLNHSVKSNDVDIYETVARLVLKKQVEFSFEGDGNLIFSKGLEKINFTPLEKEGKLATCFLDEAPFFAYDKKGVDCFHDFFYLKNNEVRLKESLVPSMFTVNKEVIWQDCLGYMMKRVTR